jgi:hypothetical protein
MRLTVTLTAALFVIGCADHAPTDPDATCYLATPGGEATTSCVAGVATVETWPQGTTSQTIHCSTAVTATATCAQGCAVETLVHEGGTLTLSAPVARTPAALCKETPEAKAGDQCADPGEPCVPTRARLAADGTVAGQDYLTCAGATCAAAAAPTIAHYLDRCDATTLQTYGKTGARGVAPVVNGVGTSACLLAWDTQTGAITSGVTTRCVGDWNCPAGALCDDALTDLTNRQQVIAVCKPGPRGTLTPAMLTP